MTPPRPKESLIEAATPDSHDENPSKSNPPLRMVVRDDESATAIFSTVTPAPSLEGVAHQAESDQQAPALVYNIYTPSTSLLHPRNSVVSHHVIDHDWTHPDKLRSLHPRHSRYRRYLLDMIDDRVERYPARFGTNRAHEDNYRKKAYLIALSDASFRDKFCHCSIPNSRNPAGTCSIRKFCPYCNHRLREQAQMMYVPAFSQGQWFSCTLSFKGTVSIDGDDGIGLELYWTACNAVIKILVSEGIIGGAYWSEELSVRELCPSLSVLPHAHAVFHCLPGVTLDLDSIREELTDMMLCALETLIGEDEDNDNEDEDDADDEFAHIDRSRILWPSIKIKPLATRRDLLFATGYVTKTIKLLGVYEAALDALDRSERWRVNVQLNHFFDALDCELLEETRAGRPWNRRQLFRAGTLLPQNGGFVGTPPAQRTTWADQQRLRRLFAELVRQPGHWTGDGEDPFAFEDIILDDSSASDPNGDDVLEDKAE